MKKKVILHTDEIHGLKRTPRKEVSFDGSFHEAIGSILALAQCFGIMPVVGIKNKSASELAFQWKSVRCICSIVVILLSIIYAGLVFWITINDEIQFIQMCK